MSSYINISIVCVPSIYFTIILPLTLSCRKESVWLISQHNYYIHFLCPCQHFLFKHKIQMIEAPHFIIPIPIYLLNFRYSCHQFIFKNILFPSSWVKFYFHVVCYMKITETYSYASCICKYGWTIIRYVVFVCCMWHTVACTGHIILWIWLL